MDNTLSKEDALRVAIALSGFVGNYALSDQKTDGAVEIDGLYVTLEKGASIDAEAVTTQLKTLASPSPDLQGFLTALQDGKLDDRLLNDLPQAQSVKLALGFQIARDSLDIAQAVRYFNEAVPALKTALSDKEKAAMGELLKEFNIPLTVNKDGTLKAT